MPFVGTDFIGVADRLMEIDARAEPEERTAIGRAYYGAFLRSRDYVDAEIEPVRNVPGIHLRVRKTLEPTNQQLARDLWRLHDLRKEADYDVPYPEPNIDRVATVAIELARNIVAQVEALPTAVATNEAGDT